MRAIVYYVAVSLDGFICGPGSDISLFVQGGDGVERYLHDLKSFDTVIMGRNTYEFGYAFGLEPGQPAYPHMDHYIFSDTLSFEQPHEKVHVRPVDVKYIHELKNKSGTDIYLCGGGMIAGWLLGEQLVDTLKIKLNPILLGSGVPIFGGAGYPAQLSFKKVDSFENGLQILTYDFR